MLEGEVGPSVKGSPQVELELDSEGVLEGVATTVSVLVGSEATTVCTTVTTAVLADPPSTFTIE